jgi:Fic family protein
MRPPFTVTPKILALVSEISFLLGRYEGIHAPVPQPELRRKNRLRTIKDSLAIEGNTLNLDQVTAIFEGKRVIGPHRDVLEVQNALRLYESLHEITPNSPKGLLLAHGLLMKGLIEDAGQYRRGSVGILKGKNVSHIAPPARQVPSLMDKLFDFLKSESEGSPLIRACVFHYELEFIHPFSDGNGRMGRFWQSLILTKYHPLFEYLPVESLIKKKQTEYYQILESCDKAGNSTAFIEFSLGTICDALADFLAHLKPEPETPQSRLSLAAKEFNQLEFSRKDYIQFFKTISTATASRDLASGVSSGILKKSGAQATARYHFTRQAKSRDK